MFSGVFSADEGGEGVPSWSDVLDWFSSALPDLSDTQAVSPPAEIASPPPLSSSQAESRPVPSAAPVSPSPSTSLASLDKSLTTLGEAFFGAVAEMFSFEDPLNPSPSPSPKAPTRTSSRTVPPTFNDEQATSLLKRAASIVQEMKKLADAAGIDDPPHSPTRTPVPAVPATPSASISPSRPLQEAPTSLFSPEPTSPSSPAVTHPPTAGQPPPASPAALDGAQSGADAERRGTASPSAAAGSPTAIAAGGVCTPVPSKQRPLRSPLGLGLLQAPRFEGAYAGCSAVELRAVTRQWLRVCGELAAVIAALTTTTTVDREVRCGVAMCGAPRTGVVVRECFGFREPLQRLGGEVRTVLFEGAAQFRRLSQLSRRTCDEAKAEGRV